MQLTSAPIDALARLRIADRGRADATGSAMMEVLKQPAEVVTATAAEWQTLLVPVRGREQVVLIGSPTNDDKSLLAIAVLRHAPYDVVVVAAERDAKSFRIRAVNVFPFH
jgi:hypothetical protein